MVLLGYLTTNKIDVQLAITKVREITQLGNFQKTPKKYITQQKSVVKLHLKVEHKQIAKI